MGKQLKSCKVSLDACISTEFQSIDDIWLTCYAMQYDEILLPNQIKVPSMPNNVYIFKAPKICRLQTCWLHTWNFSYKSATHISSWVITSHKIVTISSWSHPHAKLWRTSPYYLGEMKIRQARIDGRPVIKIIIRRFVVPLIYNLAATDTGRFSGTVADVLGWNNGEKTKIFSERVGCVV